MAEMRDRAGKLRKWLQSNKVFFETIAAAALTLMSVMVSWKSLEVSKEAYTVSKEAEDFAEAQVSPIFRTDGYSLSENELFGPPDKDFLPSYEWLRNDGAPTLRWHVKYTTFLKLTGSGTKIKWVGLTDPIEMKTTYQKTSDSEPVQTGRLAEFREWRWFLENGGFDSFLKKMYEGCDKGDKKWCRIREEHGLVTIARVEYVDKLGRVSKKPWYFTIFNSDGKMSDDQYTLAAVFDHVQNPKARYRLKELATMQVDALMKIAEE
jgi:hypothetical protein